MTEVPRTVLPRPTPVRPTLWVAVMVASCGALWVGLHRDAAVTGMRCQTEIYRPSGADAREKGFAMTICGPPALLEDGPALDLSW